MHKPTSATPFFAALLAAVAMCAAPLTAIPTALAAAPAFQAPGSLTIFSTTTGAEVEIDGKAMGKLPFDDSIMVEPGVHKIRVFLRGWTEYIDTFEVEPGGEVELEIDLIPFAGIVRINTREPGATVKVDGKIEGVTPFDKDIPVGAKSIVISRPGYYDETLDLQIQAGQEYIHDLTLRKMPGVGTDEEFYETWWFWTIVGAVAVGTATTVAVTSGGGETPPPSASFTLQIP
ncbi:MAG: PEGA domain-containing protein [Deltaproteobacteria bacterium]|nr:MAG: PEGA domain-containing protein [Deltaproteobacteria bacterium]